MFLKSKIYLTVLTLYEILAVMLLHAPRVCRSLFGTCFCTDHVFKYFVACFAIPALVGLIVMWIMEIIFGARRRHSFIYRAKNALKDIATDIGDKVSDHVSTKDIEKLVIAAVLLGIKKYASRHPDMRRKFNDMTDNKYAEYTYDSEYATDEDDDDEYDTDNKWTPSQSRRSVSVKRTNTMRKSDNRKRN